MYRFLTTLLLLSAASPAPQGSDSDVTYVKLNTDQPPPPPPPAPPAPGVRESRIENLPLTIPGNVTDGPHGKADPSTPQINGGVFDLPASSETVTDRNEPPAEATGRSGDDLTLSSSDALLSEPDYNRQGKQLEAETTEPEIATEREDHTEIDVPKRVPPKFQAKTPKLSYFQKPRSFNGGFSSNLLENSSKRKFKTKCRCEKIWNCPKLQISVPRCPNEMFYCCF